MPKSCFICSLNNPPLYEINGQIYHERCLRCSKCNISLENKPFYENKTEFLCQEDYIKYYGKFCAICNSLLIGNICEAYGQFFHPKCLKCDKCLKLLNSLDKAYLLDDKFICLFCLPKDFNSNQVKSDVYIEEPNSFKNEKSTDNTENNQSQIDQHKGNFIKHKIHQLKGSSLVPINELPMRTSSRVSQSSNQENEQHKLPFNVDRSCLLKKVPIDNDISLNKINMNVEEIFLKHPIIDRKKNYSLESLQNFLLENNKLVNPRKLEEYLSANEFKQYFSMSFQEFKILPEWKQKELKKKLNLL